MNLALNMESLWRVLSDPVVFASLKELAARDFCSEQTIFLEEVWTLKNKVLGERAKAHFPTNNLSSIKTFVETSDSLELRPVSSSSKPTSKLTDLYGSPIICSIVDDGDNIVVPHALIPQFIAVCDVFIRPGSPMELNLSAIVRRQCIDSIETRNFSVNVFNGALDQVVQSLFLNTFPKFLPS
ncbi:hypothetical protein BJ742DRAFT_800844 [Cladochytrium replicatum]|nr:hypothetical protein BJ742DRAFT_800844 [Cladochytrium replicatum]